MEFDFKSIYMSGFHLSDDLVYHIAVPLSTEIELIFDNMSSCSDEIFDKFLYELAVHLSSEEEENQINTSELSATLLQILRCKRSQGWRQDAS